MKIHIHQDDRDAIEVAEGDVVVYVGPDYMKRAFVFTAPQSGTIDRVVIHPPLNHTLTVRDGIVKVPLR